MDIPPYYLRQPPLDKTPELISSFDRLFNEQVIDAAGEPIEYKLSTPKWQFLNYLCETKGFLMHGSGDSSIEIFEPRQSNDSVEFGNQRAVYAASDAIWAAYFAICDRDRYVRSLVNTCTRVRNDDGIFESLYYFSINEDALPHDPWRTVTIYILPRDTFEVQSSKQGIESTQWRSFDSVKPLAKITIEPTNFPFLDQIRGHDVAKVSKRSKDDPDGFPWLDD